MHTGACTKLRDKYFTKIVGVIKWRVVKFSGEKKFNENNINLFAFKDFF